MAVILVVSITGKVNKRPENLRLSRLTSEDVNVILDQVAASMEHVEMFYLWRPMLRDAEDDMVLETAVNGQADKNARGLVAERKQPAGPNLDEVTARKNLADAIDIKTDR